VACFAWLVAAFATPAAAPTRSSELADHAATRSVVVIPGFIVRCPSIVGFRRVQAAIARRSLSRNSGGSIHRKVTAGSQARRQPVRYGSAGSSDLQDVSEGNGVICVARSEPVLPDDTAADALNVLAGRAKLGDIGALDELIREVRRAVLRYGAAQRLSREDADDLAQEVCLAVVKIVPDWRETGRSMWGFVFAVARNKVTDSVRRQIRQSTFGRPVSFDDGSDSAACALADGDLGPEERAVASDATKRMEELLRRLPATQREVLLLRTVVGLSAKETADALGLTPGSVHVLQHRAVTKLRALYSAPSEGVQR
jgi:RNA polymerase sigma-70 factor (ECF subfamily)